MCYDVEYVSGVWINDRKSMDSIVEQGSDRVKQAGIGTDGNKILHLGKHIWKKDK